ncbi:MAG: type II toxin-antitoxin system RelE/ParE family toxin [Deltaproteobacteria bacterium]|nr:type II toxin-antitoxin system RelE/ParE family toxin [Deltaproteobacteria bacterium]
MYKVEFTPQADEDFARLDRVVAQRVADKIDWFCQNVNDIAGEPLTGNFKGKYKIRVGDWRIIYSVERSSQIITIHAVEHRSKVYKI